MNRSLSERLRAAADELSRSERETSIRKGVRPFVRLNRALLIELHGTTGSWDDVAALLRAEGLKWKNGQPVRGGQLRSLVAATRQSEEGFKPSAQPAPTAPTLPRTERPSPSPSPSQPKAGLASLLDSAKKGEDH
ncbi:hypothetical protein [Oceanibaculum nanhaiense]|uniref:hypothetical protein n=1 Tax=Oceanibaculum nanhaiense TaxID=1909734 RepID=UPI003D2E715F